MRVTPLSPRRLTILAALLVASCYAATADDARAELRRSAWRELFPGIEHAAGEADADAPRLQQVHALRIDLQSPDLRLVLTPDNGDAPRETTSQTASQFLAEHGLQAAINVHFYGPCCAATPEGKDLVGLAVADGQVVSPAVESGTGVQVLLIDRKRRVRLASTDAPLELRDVEIAVAGSHRLLAAGQIVAPDDGENFLGPHPRTAMGVSPDGRYLLWLVIDGRQPSYSEGATLRETAEWLLRFGASDGLNLDGGGSTVLVAQGENGRPYTLNRPVGRGTPHTQRLNGSHLGVGR